MRKEQALEAESRVRSGPVCRGRRQLHQSRDELHQSQTGDMQWGTDAMGPFGGRAVVGSWAVQPLPSIAPLTGAIAPASATDGAMRDWCNSLGPGL